MAQQALQKSYMAQQAVQEICMAQCVKIFYKWCRHSNILPNNRGQRLKSKNHTRQYRNAIRPSRLYKNPICSVGFIEVLFCLVGYIENIYGLVRKKLLQIVQSFQYTTKQQKLKIKVERPHSAIQKCYMAQQAV